MRRSVLLGFIGAAVIIAAVVSIHSHQDKGEARHLYGPYWTTEGGQDTLLVFNNPLAEDVACQVTLFGPGGDPFVEHDIQLSPLESVGVSLSEFLSRPASGHLQVSFPAHLGRLPASLMIGHPGRYHPVALVDETELEETADRLEALVPDLGREGQVTRLMVSNPAFDSVAGGLIAESGGEQRKRPFTIAGKALKIFQIGHDAFVSRAALRLSLGTRGPSGLIAVAFSGDDRQSFAVKAERGRAHLTQRLGGFFGGRASELLILSDRATAARLSLTGEDGNVVTQDLLLPRGEIRRVVLEQAKGAAGLLLESDRKSRIRAWIVQSGSSSVQALKDPAAAYPHHAFPLRLNDEANTRILLYNPSAQEARFAGFFSFSDGQQWTLPLKSVAANGFAEIDLEQLRLQGAADHFQRVIPHGEVEGQVKILQKGEPAERLLVQTVIDDRPTGRSLQLESCPLCLSQPSHVAFIPGSQLSGLVGETVFVPPLIAFFTDGHSEDVTFISNIRSLNTSVAQLSPFSAHLVGAGSTAIEGEYEDPFFELDPLCVILAGALAATVAVLAEQTPDVSIGDLEGVPKNGTAGVQVNLSNSLSEHSVSLVLGPTSGSGTARFESTNSTTMNISGSRSVSIKGITESSTVDNIALKAVINGQTLAQENFSVVWVTLSFRHGPGATVSQDNSARSQYVETLGTSSLGLFRSGGETGRDFDGWHTGVEIIGTVKPPNYQGRIILNRTVNRRVYSSNCNLSQPFQGDDTSDDRLRDDAPQSGGSNGKVYDLDAPGPTFVKNMPFGVPVGTESRARQNFTEWATLDNKAKNNGPRVSDSLAWFSRVSIVMTEDGAALLNDASRDNRAGTGSESLNCK